MINVLNILHNLFLSVQSKQSRIGPAYINCADEKKPSSFEDWRKTAKQALINRIETNLITQGQCVRTHAVNLIIDCSDIPIEQIAEVQAEYSAKNWIVSFNDIKQQMFFDLKLSKNRSENE